MFKEKKAFTILEVAIAVFVLLILSMTALLTINPKRQAAVSRNHIRQSDVQAIYEALNRYALDHNGRYPESLSFQAKEICRSGVSPEICEGSGLLDLSQLSSEQKYLAALPIDPQATTTNGSGYWAARLPGRRVAVEAPLAELEQLISTTENSLISQCQANCAGKNCGSDGCGGSCGDCEAGQACGAGGVPGICACQPQCDGKNCGDDGCGSLCGLCSDGQVCGGNGTPGICSCPYEGDDSFCDRYGKNCLFTGVDNCGQTRTVNCGSCSGFDSCGGGGTLGVCGCTPSCSGKSCGSDGCGGSCGECSSGLACVDYQCSPATQECSTALAIGATCGGGVMICKSGTSNCGSINLVVAPANCVGATCGSGLDNVYYFWENPNDNKIEASPYTATHASTGYLNLNGASRLPSEATYNPLSKYVAAKYCADLTIGGFDDWYLPSPSELCAIYRVSQWCGSGSCNGYSGCLNGSSAANPFAHGIANYQYWSSREYNAVNAYTQAMPGSQLYKSKNLKLPVRCVRRF